MQFFGCSQILVQFFGFGDCCSLWIWTYFWHGFSFYLIFVAVSQISQNMWFGDIPLFIVAWGLRIFASLLQLVVCWYSSPYHSLRFAPVRWTVSNEQCQFAIDIFLYLWSISFNICLFSGPVRWEQLQLFFPSVHSK